MRHPRGIDFVAIGERAERNNARASGSRQSRADVIADRLRDALQQHAQPIVSIRREDAEELAQWLDDAEARRAAYALETYARVARFIKAHIPERNGKRQFMHPCCREFGAILIRKLEPPRR